ncbi:MAG: hypothetical protein JXB47_07795 [Anaerolineae bacterium]|nr:hypothetical protein [Anaerolineae bacterium]
MAMTNRERFNATMHYQPRDRSPIYDFGFWDQTIPAWHEQGLPKHVTDQNINAFFGMDSGLDWVHTGVGAGLAPAFETVVLEDRGDQEIVQQSDGARVLRNKYTASIPQHMGHLLTDRASWEKHYKPRLDPTTPGRYPADWDARVKNWRDPNRPNVVALPGGSLYGWLREWMGLEAISYLVYDDPALFEEMVTTVADCIIGVLTRLLETGGHFDGVSIWEDMCYRAGPLLSPRHFKQYLTPHYRRISDLVRAHGVDVLWVDCDGNIDDLLPLWLDAGINCMFPVEVGVWGADPVKYRKQYGKELLIMGGFSKLTLTESKEAIKKEVHRLAPLVEEGGFIGFCDHRVPPTVPLENYMFYLKTVREVWGKGVNLAPMEEL